MTFLLVSGKIKSVSHERMSPVNLEEKIIAKKTIHQGRITQYDLWQVELADGNQAEREIVLHDDAAAVIAFDSQERMIFVRQYRVAIEQESIEIPAGLIDERDDSPLSAARRELEEETGFYAHHLERLTGFYQSPGYCDEYLHIFRATDLEVAENPLPQDDDEYLEVMALTYDEAVSYLQDGLICDSKTVYALLYWKYLRDMDKE